MAKYTKGMLLFGLVGVLVVSMWCMKGTEAASSGGGDDDDKVIHAVKREEPEGCGNKNNEGGVEECSGEDDSLGLYADVDDTFRAQVKKAANNLRNHLTHHLDDHELENLSDDHDTGNKKN